MAPIVHMIRHAQGFHDLPPQSRNAGIHDPDLTEEGKAACRDFCSKFPIHDAITLLCCSALRRTIQTTQLCFEPELQRGMKIVTLPDAQEANAEPSNTGSPIAKLQDEFGAQLDLCQMTEYWYRKVGRYEPSHEALMERARRLRRFLRSIPGGEVALVIHGYFAHYVLCNVDDHGKQKTREWEHLEWRTFTFPNLEGDEALLQESKASMARRKSLEAAN